MFVVLFTMPSYETELGMRRRDRKKGITQVDEAGLPRCLVLPSSPAN